jgi:outer membrane protein assembly factor BamB
MVISLFGAASGRTGDALPLLVAVCLALGLAPGAAAADPGISVEPDTLSFGTQSVGTNSAAQTVTVTNTGTTSIRISTIFNTGGNRDDFLGTQTCTDAPLAPGDACSISVWFAPQAAGPRATTLTIAGNFPGTTRAVSLSGTGAGTTTPPGSTPPPGDPSPSPGTPPSGSSSSRRGVPAISLSPARLSFPPRAVGTTSEPQGVLIASTGTAPLVIRSVRIAGVNPGDFAITSGSGGGTLAEGLSRRIQVIFSPQAVGSRSATLQISDTAAGSPHQVALSGTGEGALPGDWPVFMHDPRQLGLAEAGLDPRRLSLWSLLLGGRSVAPPVVTEGTAYVGLESGDVVAIDVGGRKPRWRRTLPAPIRGSLAAGPKVVVAAAEGLYGLSPASGATLWRRADLVVPAGIAPMLVGDTLYLPAPATGGDGTAVYAVAAATGANAWPAPVLLPEESQARTGVAVWPELGALYLGIGSLDSARTHVANGEILALRLADGAPLWPSPARLAGAEPPTGLSLGWVFAHGPAAEPKPALFIVTGAGVSALDATSGALLWSRPLPERLLPGPPVVSTAAKRGAVLYVGAAGGRISALDTASGADAPGGMSEPVAPLTGPLALAGSLLYVPTMTELVGVDVATGLPAWSSPLAASSGVAVAGGSPFLVTGDDRFVGFSP